MNSKHFKTAIASSLMIVPFVGVQTVALAGTPENTEQPSSSIEETWESTQESVSAHYEKSKDAAADIWSDVQSYGEETYTSAGTAFRDGWVIGKLETAYLLNEHLNPMQIDVGMEGETIILSGNVAGATQRDLAEEIAFGIEGVADVDNQLVIAETHSITEASPDVEADRDFGQVVEDATTTASITMSIIGLEEVDWTSVDVDTRNDVVFLRGEVDSTAERELVERVAQNNSGVTSVVNELRVRVSS